MLLNHYIYHSLSHIVCFKTKSLSLYLEVVREDFTICLLVVWLFVSGINSSFRQFSNCCKMNDNWFLQMADIEMNKFLKAKSSSTSSGIETFWSFDNRVWVCEWKLKIHLREKFCRHLPEEWLVVWIFFYLIVVGTQTIIVLLMQEQHCWYSPVLCLRSFLMNWIFSLLKLQQLLFLQIILSPTNTELNDCCKSLWRVKKLRLSYTQLFNYWRNVLRGFLDTNQ